MKAKYFTLKEMLSSATASEQGFDEQFTPPVEVVNNLEALCKNILDPLREAVGPIRVTSGYRCKRLNTAVKGSNTSQHTKGQAADIKGIKVSNAELFHKIQKMNLPFDQLIWEYGTEQDPDWVHVSFGPLNRKQILLIGVK